MLWIRAILDNVTTRCRRRRFIAFASRDKAPCIFCVLNLRPGTTGDFYMIYNLENNKHQLMQWLDERHFSKVRKWLLEQNAVDIAALFGELPSEQQPKVYRLLPKTLAAEAFAYMETDTQEVLIHAFTDRELAAMLAELYLDDTADLLEEMPANVVKRLLRVSSPDDRRTLNQILRYPENSAGSVLTTEFVDLKADMTVEAALRHIRVYGPDKETIYTCYVTGNDRRLQGVLSAKQLLLAREDDCVGDLMNTNVISTVTTEDQEQVADLFARYDLIALPVVDSENRLVGIITVDDVVDIMREETTEDIEKMAAIIPTDKPYLRIGVWELFRNRIPWLLLLMVSATFTGMIITAFESALAVSVALTAFIPMLMGTGGNSGSQSSVTVIRSLALDDIRFSDLFRVLWKECRVALLCGAVLAVATFVKILAVDRWILGMAVTLPETAVVCVALFITVLIAKLVGCSLPLLAKRVGFDPAVMASPFITTIVDAISLLVYFGVASVIFSA